MFDRRRKVLANYAISFLIPALAVLVSLFTNLPDSALIASLSALILAQVAFLYSDLSSELDDLTSSIQETDDVVRPVRESDFYQSLYNDINQAEKRVYLSYFANSGYIDPRDRPDEMQSMYYDNLETLVNSDASAGVQFRRMVLAVPGMEDWVRDLIETREGIPGYSLACLPYDAADLVGTPVS